MSLPFLLHRSLTLLFTVFFNHNPLPPPLIYQQLPPLPSSPTPPPPPPLSLPTPTPPPPPPVYRPSQLSPQYITTHQFTYPPPPPSLPPPTIYPHPPVYSAPLDGGEESFRGRGDDQFNPPSPVYLHQRPPTPRFTSPSPSLYPPVYTPPPVYPAPLDGGGGVKSLRGRGDDQFNPPSPVYLHQRPPTPRFTSPSPSSYSPVYTPPPVYPAPLVGGGGGGGGGVKSLRGRGDEVETWHLVKDRA